jgi:hypothetical protein
MTLKSILGGKSSPTCACARTCGHMLPMGERGRDSNWEGVWGRARARICVHTYARTMVLSISHAYDGTITPSRYTPGGAPKG